MDNYGLLTLLRQLDSVITTIGAEARDAPTTWTWNATPVVMPESKCPYCLAPIRSKAIWFLGGNKHERLLGILKLDSKKVELIYPNHPHDIGGGHLCLGKNTDGIALLASTPNTMDAPMGRWHIPMWLKEYWGHPCMKAREYLRDNGYQNQVREYER